MFLEALIGDHQPGTWDGMPVAGGRRRHQTKGMAIAGIRTHRFLIVPSRGSGMDIIRDKAGRLPPFAT